MFTVLAYSRMVLVSGALYDVVIVPVSDPVSPLLRKSLVCVGKSPTGKSAWALRSHFLRYTAGWQGRISFNRGIHVIMTIPGTGRDAKTNQIIDDDGTVHEQEYTEDQISKQLLERRRLIIKKIYDSETFQKAVKKACNKNGINPLSAKEKWKLARRLSTHSECIYFGRVMPYVANTTVFKAFFRSYRK